MGKMTQELIEDLYIRGRAVYKKEISLKCATEEILNMYPDNIHESSAQFYLSLYSDLIKGKGSTWNQNSDLLVYFVRHIVEENGVADGVKAYEGALKFAKAKSRKSLVANLEKLAAEFKLSVNGRLSFEAWLNNFPDKHYSESTIYRYVRALEKSEEWLGVQFTKPILDITLIEEFSDIDNHIKKLSNYEQVNQQHGHGDLSAALTLYKKYVEYLNQKKSDWWPALEEYNPAITKEQWLELLKDGTTFTDNAYFAIAAMYVFGGTATCMQLEEKYGRTADFYRASLGVQLANKIKNIFDLPYCSSDNDGNKVWPVLFQGRNANNDEVGNYVWRMRPELYEALKEFGIERYLKEGEKKVPELSIKESLKLIKEYIVAKGFSYNDELIENFYLSLKSKPFVILAGTSGTGKTRLIRLFSEAIGAKYKLVSVRPDWSDSSDLFGHVNLKGEFIPGAIIDYIYEAAKSENLNTPYFLCLDEMNLARVEYYLSDFLSIIETRHQENGHVVTDEIVLDKAAEDVYGKIILPENLYVIGTVNMDETTFPFSKKVLDRANTIEFSYVDLVPDFSERLETTEIQPCRNNFLKTDYLTLMSDIAIEDRKFVVDICAELQDINKILQSAQAHVGYRVRDEIVFYMLNNKKADLLDKDLAFDNEIMQKILPRVQGSSESIKDMLCELYKKCAGDYTGLSQASVSEQMQAYIETKDCKYRKSAEKICYMMRRFEEDGFTSYWL